MFHIDKMALRRTKSMTDVLAQSFVKIIRGISMKSRRRRTRCRTKYIKDSLFLGVISCLGIQASATHRVGSVLFLPGAETQEPHRLLRLTFSLSPSIIAGFLRSGAPVVQPFIIRL